MRSVQNRNLLNGCSNYAAQLGYQQKGAVPLLEPEMQNFSLNAPEHGQHL